MNTLIIDIRENCLRAVLSNDGVLEYCRKFDLEPLPQSGTDALPAEDPSIQHAPAPDNPYLVYYGTEERNPLNLALKKIVKQIRSDINTSIGSTHLIIPSDEVTLAVHQLPKMSRADVQRVISRKISAETREEFPPFSIIPGASDQKTQTWCSLYIPTTTLRNYRKAFSSCRLCITSITTPVNAMLDAFRNVRESIFNAHAIFEIQRGFIEAFYISADGILHFQRLPYASSSAIPENTAVEAEKARKLKIFKIINTIFSVNSHYLSAHPSTPVQMAWVCGFESGLENIAAVLKEAMGIEVGIAPPFPTGLPDESSYVPLAGFAAALQSNSATTYAAADIFRRLPFHRTPGLIVFAIASCAALLTITQTEREYRKIQEQVHLLQKPPDLKPGKSRAPVTAAYIKNLDTLKKLSSRQFVFYNLFRELATDLPDGVYLENLEFRLKDDKGFIDITALARLDDKIAENMLLTKLMTMFDRSPSLKNHREPVITVFARDGERLIKITVTCEVNQLEATK